MIVYIFSIELTVPKSNWALRTKYLQNKNVNFYHYGGWEDVLLQSAMNFVF